jgi:2-oxoglutarate ferredoxin oxidoreductase subunit alpha
VERISGRFPQVGGIFIQMEDEIASSIAILGGAWAGKKVMTVTSGPGFSLMMEHIGLAVMTETPCVYVNVQRGGPSTGLPTMPGQADMMQARWGSHGDYEIIALAPNSPQECFDLTVKAFNLAERWRVPVFLMMDECVGHMTERVDIPAADRIEVEPRRFTTKKPGEYLPYAAGEDGVPEMAKAGDGHRIHITGLTHDERGYPSMTPKAQEKLISRLIGKIRKNEHAIRFVEEEGIDGADVVIVSYGITSRVALNAVEMAREKGVKVGVLRLIVCWPFPEARIRELAPKVRAFVVPEMNYGQMVREVERAAAGRAKTILVPHAGGTVHEPRVILDAIMEAVR